MCRRGLKIVCLAASLLSAGPARAQAPSAEATAAARELVVTMRVGDQFKAVLPTIAQALRPTIVQGRPEVDRDYDAIMRAVAEISSARVSELNAPLAAIYVKTFTAAELKELIAFYRSPTGQKLLEKTPFLTQQVMATGQQFAATLMEDVKNRIVEELRKKGHRI